MGPAQPCGSIHVFQGTEVGRDSSLCHMPSPLTLVFVDYCYTLMALGLHHRCHDVSFCCSLILLFIISPRVCYASSLCLSNTHKHPLLQDHDPLFLPSTRNIQLCLFSKAQFPNKVKLQLQRLCSQLFHTQYGSPASSHVVLEYCLQGTHGLGMVLLMLESHHNLS